VLARHHLFGENGKQYKGQGMAIILLVGPPGAGKGTQSERLVKENGWKTLSTGEALRKHIREQTELGKKAKRFVDDGQLVPDDLILGMLLEELGSLGKSQVLLDGYPRNVTQAQTLETMPEHLRVKIALHLDINKDELMSRIAKRHEELGRSDDTPEKFAKRIEVYETQTKPVLDFYRQKGLYHQVDAGGSEKDVFARIQGVFQKQGLIS